MELTRRQALAVAAMATGGAVAAVVGGVGTWRTVSGTPVGPGRAASGGLRPGATGTDLHQPTVLASRGGLLAVDLVAAPGVTLAGVATRALGYNGTSPGPTLRVRAGDVLRVRLVNRLPEATNLHTHGLHVAPTGNGDNVFRHVEPGGTAQYEYRVPADHPAGTFWYHPHHHGHVADQVFGGLLGAIIVEPAATSQVAPPERVLVVSDTTLTGRGTVAAVSPAEVVTGREGHLVLVNGQLRPRIHTTAGATERWRVVNACVSRFLSVQLDGHTLGLLGHDGQGLHAPQDRGSVLLAPGNRVDLLVRPGTAGSYALRTLARDRGAMGVPGGGGGTRTSPETVLATVEVTAAGAPADHGAGAPSASALGLAPLPDLRRSAVDARRTITFTMGMDGMGGGMGTGMGGGAGSGAGSRGQGPGMTFGFDGRGFDPARVDQQARLGAVEEWTIANPTPMDHPFHLHVWPMQLLASSADGDVGPGAGSAPDWRDVVVVPAFGEVRVRVHLRNFAGRTVYHCHILDHEDLGMMGSIAVSG